MDTFKKHGESHCGCGGRHCQCCNPFQGKDKKKLNRIARRTLHQDDEKMFKKVVDEQE